MRVRLRDISERLALSTATVSRALKDDPAIAVATRARVAAAAAELGYRANTAARTLVTGRSRVIGLHVSRLSGWYVAMALRFQALVEADGYAAILTSGGNAPPAHVDGDIGIGTLPAHVLRGEPRPGTRRPVVAIDVQPEVDYVAVDLYSPAQAAMRHLLREGRRRIAIVLPGAGSGWAPTDARKAGPRERAYLEAMRSADLPIETVSPTDSTRTATREGVLAHVREHGLPDALFCHNDDIAIGAYRALVEL